MLGFGPFELHPASRRLQRDGRPLALRASAVEILLALVEQAGQVVSKRLLCERAWPGRDVDENNLQVEVSALRKLIGAGAIVTASGRGYQFAWPVVRGPGDAGNTLIGRDADAAALRRLLAPGALVSIVGEGGVGKSRLARSLLDRSGCAVQLDDACTEAQVLAAVGAALQLGAVARPALLQALAGKPRLLWLDGCDAALLPVAELAATLLTACPALTLLATSREVLRVPDERVYRLGPLASDDASRLFVERGGGDLERCAALGGLPLAIELAAREGEPMPGAPARQQSLQASFESSCAGLAAADRTLLAALVSLAQPFGLDAVMELALIHGIDRWQRLDALARLVDKSLIVVDAVEPPCYRLAVATRLYFAAAVPA